MLMTNDRGDRRQKRCVDASAVVELRPRRWRDFGERLLLGDAMASSNSPSQPQDFHESDDEGDTGNRTAMLTPFSSPHANRRKAGF